MLVNFTCSVIDNALFGVSYIFFNKLVCVTLSLIEIVL